MNGAELQDKSVAELKELAVSLGIDVNAIRRTKGRPANKTDLVEAITAKQSSAEWKNPYGEGKRTAAKLVRAGLRAGIPDDEITAEVRRQFPDYGAWKIAVAGYRKELLAKGEKLPAPLVKSTTEAAA